MTENKIYSEWVFADNSDEKRESNKLALSELNEKYKIVRDFFYKKMTDEEKEKVDVVYHLGFTGYSTKTYFVTKNKPGLSDLELALICDEGNLCFGYRRDNNGITIYID